MEQLRWLYFVKLLKLILNLIEPNMAVYELINYDKCRVDEAIAKLLLFDKLNNADINELMAFSLESKNSIELPHAEIRNFEALKKELTKYKKLFEWDTFYLFVLSIVEIDKSNLTRSDKITVFIQWMFEKFKLSLVALVFSVFCFGQRPLKKIIKYKADDSISKKIKGLKNMTWDLYIIDQYFKKWINKSSNQEFLYASDDKAFKQILTLAIKVQVKKDISPIKDFLNTDVYSKVYTAYSAKMPDEKRAYHNAKGKFGYRKKMIAEKETSLGITGKEQSK